MELLIGCGSNRAKKLSVQGRSEWVGLVTLDHEPRHKPDVVYDLAHLPLPFDDNSADEIHAYECLEHVGAQGDYKTRVRWNRLGMARDRVYRCSISDPVQLTVTDTLLELA